MNKFLRNPRTLAFAVALLSFTLVSQVAFAHGMSEAEKQAIVDGGNLAYLWLGATHMLTGYDHLAFVFGIIFFLTNFREIAKYITAFTVGHSVTLIGATFAGLQLDYFLIDAVIGLSVSYIAFHNLDGFRKYFDVEAPNMMFMIVALGLIHGFGLSTRLQDLPLSEDSLLVNIISFNVGVELGQVTALALMLVVVAAWRKREGFAKFSRIANVGLILWGCLLFLMQMHGYEHATNAELVPVSSTTASPAATPATEWRDTITVEIPARGNKEYKFLIEQGATLEYSWQTDGPKLFFDFHGEPTAGPRGYFESFKKGTESQSTGNLTSTFAGTHGWYWKNRGTTPVTITLKANGAYQRIDLAPEPKAAPVVEKQPAPTEPTKLSDEPSKAAAVESPPEAVTAKPVEPKSPSPAGKTAKASKGEEKEKTDDVKQPEAENPARDHGHSHGPGHSH